MLQSRVQEAGETKDQCRSRVLRFCRASWNTAGGEGESLRRKWQLQAIEANSVVPVPPDVSSNTAIVPARPESEYMSPLAAFGGFGSLGIGDGSFGMSIASVSDADAKPGFVQNYSTAWRNRVALETTSDTPDQAGTTRLSCLETFGFCKTCVDRSWEKYTSLVSHILKYVAKYRQLHLVNGRNKGPNAALQIPLLFAFTGRLSCMFGLSSGSEGGVLR